MIENITGTETTEILETSTDGTYSILFTRKKGRSTGVSLYYEYETTGDETDISLSFKTVDNQINEEKEFSYKQIDASDNLITYSMTIPKATGTGRIPLSFTRNEDKIIILATFTGTSGSEGTLNVAVKEDYPDWHQKQL